MPTIVFLLKYAPGALFVFLIGALGYYLPVLYRMRLDDVDDMKSPKFQFDKNGIYFYQWVRLIQRIGAEVSILLHIFENNTSELQDETQFSFPPYLNDSLKADILKAIESMKLRTQTLESELDMLAIHQTDIVSNPAFFAMRLFLMRSKYLFDESPSHVVQMLKSILYELEKESYSRKLYHS